MRLFLARLAYRLGFNVDSGFLLDNWIVRTFQRLRCRWGGHWRFYYVDGSGVHITRCNRCDLYIECRCALCRGEFVEW